jgi:hypothetical protein
MHCIWRFAIFIIAQSNSEFKKVLACGRQWDAHEPRSEDSNEVEIYFEHFNPDKCNYGEWSKGRAGAYLYRKMDYRDIIDVSVIGKDNEGPSMTRTRLYVAVKEKAETIGANLVCGGKLIEKSTENSYEFVGTGFRSCSDTMKIVYFLLPTMQCTLFWMNSIVYYAQRCCSCHSE